MKKILCVGTLILDIINSKVDRLPGESECVAADVTLNLGGNAYSTSVNLRRLATEETSVHCYGLTGKDDPGNLFENGLKREGVISHLTKLQEKSTSCNIILQEKNKDRRYIFNDGANSSASTEKLKEIIDLVKPDVLVFGEIPSLGLTGTDFIETLDYAKKNHGSLIFLDLMITADETYDWLTGHWNTIDIIHCNTSEGAYITKKTPPEEICRWFMNNGVALSIVSDGPKGCFYGHNNRTNHVPAFKTKEIDATGAGDAMTAGTVTKLLQYSDQKGIHISKTEPKTIEKIITFASACGAIAVGALGCISDISKEKVKNLLNKNKL